LLDLPWAGGKEFVRGKPCQHKHFSVKPATFLCGAAYLPKNACGALIKVMVPRNTALHAGLIDSPSGGYQR
jgi:hypothetical protein